MKFITNKVCKAARKNVGAGIATAIRRGSERVNGLGGYSITRLAGAGF
jgi:hypothetical protein